MADKQKGGYVLPEGITILTPDAQARMQQQMREQSQARHGQMGIPYPGGAASSSIRDLIVIPNGGDTIGSFDFGKQGAMDKHKGNPLKGVLPNDLAAKVDEMGKQFLAVTERNGKSIVQTKEFAGMDIAGVDGKPDARKVGAILLAAASYQEVHNKTDGPFTFDNKLTFTDLDRLNDPAMKKLISERAESMLFSKDRGQDSLLEALRQNGALDRVQGAAQQAGDAGIQPAQTSTVRCPSFSFNNQQQAPDKGRCGR